MCRKENTGTIYGIADQNGKYLYVCKKCKQANELKGQQRSETVRATPAQVQARPLQPALKTRPVGITLLVIFQLFAVAMIVFYESFFPFFLGRKALILGSVYQVLFFIETIIIIPLLLFFSYGLLKGWGRVRSYNRFFIIISLVAAIIDFNVITAVVFAFLFYYLGTSYVRRYFDGSVAFSSPLRPVAITGCIAFLILNSSLAIYTNPYVYENILQKNALASMESRLVGTWQRTSSLVLVFYANHTCTATSTNITTNGTWSFYTTNLFINLHWTKPLILTYPSDPSRTFIAEQADFIGENLMLSTYHATPKDFICTKN
jgi:hypothetical protein